MIQTYSKEYVDKLEAENVKLREQLHHIERISADDAVNTDDNLRTTDSKQPTPVVQDNETQGKRDIGQEILDSVKVIKARISDPQIIDVELDDIISSENERLLTALEDIQSVIDAIVDPAQDQS